MPSISAKEASKIATSYYVDVSGRSSIYISLEEIEYDSQDGMWNVTLGYRSSPASLLSGQPPQDLKVFRIDGASGDVLSMKIKRSEAF